MLVASPVLAWQPGPGEGNKYPRNYYPTGTYFKYCEPEGSQFLGTTKANTAHFTVVGLLGDSQHARNNLGRLGR
jgi:hypothetical protein